MAATGSAVGKKVGGSSPITIRHGSTVIYVKEVADLEAVLAAVKGSSVPSTLGQGEVGSTLTGDIFQLGVSAQSLISGLVGEHCPCLRDGLFKMKKSMKVGAPLAKKLTQLNSTSSLLRHFSEQWGKDLLHELQGMAQAGGKLGGGLEFDSGSCQSVGSAGDLESSDDAEADPVPEVLFGKVLSSALVAAQGSEVATEVIGSLGEGDAAAGKGVVDMAKSSGNVSFFDLFAEDSREAGTQASLTCIECDTFAARVGFFEAKVAGLVLKPAGIDFACQVLGLDEQLAKIQELEAELARKAEDLVATPLHWRALQSELGLWAEEEVWELAVASFPVAATVLPPKAAVADDPDALGSSLQRARCLLQGSPGKPLTAAGEWMFAEFDLVFGGPA